ncbi:hypothetical protein GCM10022254_64490 [Actinomadura meridiana]|uniref:Lipoprotein n=1 Tax=Actinomadura meridiana TaxID=559626 RepID=A0ABP8CK82_9ACTN
MRPTRMAARTAAVSAMLALAVTACGGEGGDGARPGRTSGSTAAPSVPAPATSGPPAVYTIGDAPPSGTGAASGVVLTQEVNAGGRTACVVLALKDGKLGEVGRFGYPANTAGQDPAHGFEPCDQRTSFTTDFTQMAGVRSYRVRPGVDRHPALLAMDGTVTDISGRGDKGVAGASQSNPTIEPTTGRVWMWRTNPNKGVGNPTMLLHSMKPDGSDARDESAAQPKREDRRTSLMFVGQQFTFLGGQPIYVETAKKAIATPDGRTAVFSDLGEYRVGPIATLRTNPALPVTGAVTSIKPQVFLPDDGTGSRFVATSGEKIVLCAIGDSAITTTLLYEPTDMALKFGISQSSFVAADDGSVYYTVRNRVPAQNGAERVARLVRLKDGQATVVAVVAADSGTATPLTALTYVK